VTAVTNDGKRATYRQRKPAAPGRVTLSLDPRAFSYWDEAKHRWTIDPGRFVVLVGDSSENTPLHAELAINETLTKNQKGLPLFVGGPFGFV